MARTIKAVVVSALATLLDSTTVAVASSADGSTGSRETTAPSVEFSLFGGPEAGVDGLVAEADLAAFGISTADIDEAMHRATTRGLDTIEMVSEEGTSQDELDTYLSEDWPDVTEVNSGDFSTDPSPTATSPFWVIKSTWKDVKGRTMVMRVGSYNPKTQSGWGLAKVIGKHNLTTKAVQAATKYTPTRYQNNTSTAYAYYQPVQKYACSGWGIFRKCKVVATTNVVTVHETKAPSDGKPRGVITSYCQNYQPRCPDWVKNAANI